ncbi:M48 family metallopeptidase [uncultured Dialister sp.]|uniref:M48 family metallopeptidase n=1 Tax=uncultured Dialister sp. TaxID=278064 RepID=UPI002613072D|nr:M48 family metallopeptidase [uncultured Dialister sp.]
MKKKILCQSTAAALALACALGIPAPTAEAFSIGDIIGIAQGAAQYAMLDKQFNYYNDTEEGRQELFKSYQEKMGVVHDEAKEEELSGIMNRLTDSIGAEDPSIYKKPYIYFIAADESFNASCSMGHVMVVNDGLFKYLTNTDEIAVVLGHEMGHGQKNHVMNALHKKAKTELGAAILSGAIGDAALGQEVLGIAVNQIETVQIGRGDEKEADKLSFDYIYRAGYNPGATAALWQRVIEKGGDNDPSFAQEVFAPSDHPSNSQRRDTYEKRLTELSKKHVTLKSNTDTVMVNGQEFVTPAPAGDMSAAERKYFVLGNLAAAYDHGENSRPAEARDGTVYLGNQAVITPVNGDPSAQVLAERLNKIK